MHIGRTILFPILAASGVLSLGFSSVFAASFPERPVEMIVPWGVGGGADQFARAFAPIAEQKMGVPMPVVNAPGSASDIGLAKLKSLPADGHAVAIYISGSLARSVFGKSPHKPSDFNIIIRLKLVPTFLMASDKSNIKDAKALIAQAKKGPGKLRAAGTGKGTMDDLALRFMATKGSRITLVSYAKPAERYAAALGGHNELLMEQAGDVFQYIKAGKLHPLIAFTSNRVSAFPDVPTGKELGFNVNHELWLSLVARAGTPKDRISFLAKKFESVYHTKKFQTFAKSQLFHEKSLMKGDELQNWVKQEYKNMGKLLDQFGLRKEK